MIQHTFGLLTRPSAQWKTVAGLPDSSFKTLVLYPWFLAILPAVAWYYGTSQVGWTVGEHGETIKLTEASARQICILFYLTMVACVSIIGYFIHWMSDTYGAQSTVSRKVLSLPVSPQHRCSSQGWLVFTRCSGWTCWWASPLSAGLCT